MRYFPIFLDLTRKTCMVVGAGKVGQRKIKTLLKCSPENIIVMDPYVELIEVQDPGKIVRHMKANFKPEHLEGCDLVFACTADPDINDLVVRACLDKNIWCNVAERPDQGNFILPGVFSRQEMIVAVSTCGCSPALTSRVKQELEDIYGPEYGLLTQLLAGVRKILLPLNLPQEKNREYFRKIVESDAALLLRSGHTQEITSLLYRVLPREIHKQIKGITDDLL